MENIEKSLNTDDNNSAKAKGQTTESIQNLAIKDDEEKPGDFLRPKLPVQSSTNANSRIETASQKEEKFQQEIELELRYTEPIWARIPSSSKSYIEVIKDGSIIENIPLDDSRKKSYLAIGRFDPCDIKLEHPSVSRFHAVLQYGELNRGKPQWFIFDMNSTHGVKVNKKPIAKNTFVPLSGGYVFQIAGSSRIFVLNDVSEHEKEEDQEKQVPSNVQMENPMEEDNKAEEEEMESHVFYEKDPLYWLERYFEREGTPMSFRFTKTVESSGLSLISEKKTKSKGEDSDSNWICSIELISDISLAGGTMVSATAPSKRLAQLQCARVACRRLDEARLLQISSLWNKRTTYAENDFYEEDEDTFYDRTGQIEEQREKRKRRYEGDPNASEKAKTYDDLLKELSNVDDKLNVIKSEIKRLIGTNTYAEDVDGANKLNFSTRMMISKMKSKEKKLLEEKAILKKMASIAKPSHELLMRISNKIPNTSTTTVEQSDDKIATLKVDDDVKQSNETDDIKLPAAKTIEEKIESVEEKTDLTKRIKEEDTPRLIATSSMQSKSTNIPQSHTKEERFYSPAMPSKAEAETIAPKFGMLTKEEMVQLKLLQRQREKNLSDSAAKRKRISQEDQNELCEENAIYDGSEKYATWLPPEDQSGDGQTRLNQKFAGKY